MEKRKKRKEVPMMEFTYLLAMTGVIGLTDIGAGMTAFVAFLMYTASDACEKEYKVFFKLFFYVFIILTIVLAALKHMNGGY